jgi:membrane-associated phospholipid phosphatase
MKKSKLLLLLLLGPLVLTAQVDTLRLNRAFIKKGWDDTKTLVTAPAHWDGRDWATFGVVSASVAALFLVDEPVNEAFQNWHEHAGASGERISANFLEPWGAEYSLAVMGGLMGYGLLAKNGKSQSTALLAGESFVLSALFLQIPKRLIGRSRPNSGDDPFQFNGPFKGSALPSGHTTAVFAVASVIANQYSDTPAVPIISYTIATAAGLSRIYDNRHWLSDVVGGATLGIAIGNLVSGKRNDTKRVVIVPFSSGQFQGLRLAYTL